MTIAGLLGAVLGVVSALAGAYRIYITWHAKRDAKKEREAISDARDKYQREAAIHAGPRRSKHDIIHWMRDRAN